jgi:hypothetical protein
MLRSLALIASAAAAAAAPLPFVPGNVVALRADSSAGARDKASAPAFLDEISLAPGAARGTVKQSIALAAQKGAPGVFGPQASLELGVSQSQGGLARSSSGALLTFMGNNPDAPPPVFTIAVCNASGVCDTSGQTGAALGDNNGRSSVSDDGLTFWSTGTNGVEVEVCTPGAGCAQTMIQEDVNFRALTLAQNTLYGTSQTKGFSGLVSFGAVALPLAPAAAVSVFNPVPASGKYEPQALRFIASDKLLIADTYAKGDGGIGFFTFVEHGWSLNSTLAASGHAHWIEYDACTATVFFIADPAGTSTKFSPTTVSAVSLNTTTGVWGSPTLLASAPAGSIWQCLAMAPWTGGAGKCPPPQ